MARKKTADAASVGAPSSITRDAAAALLGCPTREVVDVEDSPAGTIITTFDGSRLVLVPEDTPDAEGKTGLMFLTCPEGYRGTFPVYAQPIDDDAVVDDEGDGGD